jgi:hypothetical protein
MTNSKVDRHPEYYFDIVIFLVSDTLSSQLGSRSLTNRDQVENQLFRVPRRNFATQSNVFSDMFQLPPQDGTPPEGSSDDRPIRLDGIAKSSFTQLLRIMFPL